MDFNRIKSVFLSPINRFFSTINQGVLSCGYGWGLGVDPVAIGIDEGDEVRNRLGFGHVALYALFAFVGADAVARHNVCIRIAPFQSTLIPNSRYYHFVSIHLVLQIVLTSFF